MFACFLYITMACNGLTLTTPGSFSSDPGIHYTATPAHQQLISHMLARIWNGKGKLDTPNPIVYTCTNLSFQENCNGVVITSLFSTGPTDNYLVDTFEATLIKQIWGPLWAGAPK